MVGSGSMHGGLLQWLQWQILSIQPMADDDDAERLWKKFMKTKRAKTKKIKRSSEWYSESAEITGLGNGIDMYATFENTGDDVRMVVWFNMGDDYLSSELGCWQACYFLEEPDLMDSDQFVDWQKVESGAEDIIH